MPENVTGKQEPAKEITDLEVIVAGAVKRMGKPVGFILISCVPDSPAGFSTNLLPQEAAGLMDEIMPILALQGEARCEMLNFNKDGSVRRRAGTLGEIDEPEDEMTVEGVLKKATDPDGPDLYKELFDAALRGHVDLFNLSPENASLLAAQWGSYAAIKLATRKNGTEVDWSQELIDGYRRIGHALLARILLSSGKTLTFRELEEDLGGTALKILNEELGS